MQSKSRQITYTLAAFALIPTAMAAFLSACGGSGGSGAAPAFAYVANAGSNDIAAYKLNSTGELARIPCTDSACNVTTGNFAAGTNPASASVDPGGKFLYVANTVTDDVSAYRIGSDGKLALIDCGGGSGCIGSNFAAGDAPRHIAVDPTGKFVYVANNTDISGYSIDPSSGSLTRIVCSIGCSGENFPTGSLPYQIAFDSNGKFAYVVNAGSDSVWVYLIETTGALTYNGSYGTGVFPVAIAVEPGGKFAYVANTSSGDISAYTINTATGALTPVACTAASGCSTTGARFLSGASPWFVTVDPTGQSLYVANINGSDVSAFSIYPTTGSLTKVACTTGCSVGGNFASGINPYALSFDPQGNFVYVANFGDSDISAFARDHTTGVLTPIACSGTGCDGTRFADGVNLPQSIVTVSP